jgi:hypothetical protein
MTACPHALLPCRIRCANQRPIVLERNGSDGSGMALLFQQRLARLDIPQTPCQIEARCTNEPTTGMECNATDLVDMAIESADCMITIQERAIQLWSIIER